jgi:hypothetical protein
MRMLLAIALVLLSSGAQDDNFLDLVKASEEMKEEMKTKTYTRLPPRPGVLIHRAPQKKPAPLKVTLLNVNSASYQISEQVVFEIMLENISKEAVAIPWSIDFEKALQGKNSAPGYNALNIKLVFSDEKKTEVSKFLGMSTYGSDLLPGSLKMLQPGQKVTMRVPGYFNFMIKEDVGRVHGDVYAQVSFTFGNYEDARSGNSRPVEVRRPSR